MLDGLKVEARRRGWGLLGSWRAGAGEDAGAPGEARRRGWGLSGSWRAGAGEDAGAPRVAPVRETADSFAWAACARRFALPAVLIVTVLGSACSAGDSLTRSPATSAVGAPVPAEPSSRSLSAGGGVADVSAPAAATVAPTLPPPPALVVADPGPRIGEALETLASRIEAERQRRGVTGLSVAVVRDQSLIWSRGFGTANVETGAPATPQTLYRVGSITKLFTDTMLMQLRDAGKLQLDDPVRQYLPEFDVPSRFGASQPTFRELASHTSGLPREAPLNYWRARVFPTEQELLASLADTGLVGKPGAVYQYSNLGVAVEGAALERVARDSYTNYVTRHILQPLGMSDSGFELTDRVRARLAMGSTLASTAPDTERLPDFGALAPAAALYTSVEDMARFMSLQLRDGDADMGPVLSGPTLREMRSADSRGGPSDFAIGWELSSVAGQATAGHPGIVYGFTSQITLVPDAKLGVAVFTNGRTDPATLCSMILAALLPVI